jgi:sulfofructosephosphate aldolase
LIADPVTQRERLGALARANGTFALLALDQRETLRTMLANAGHPSDDSALRGFKVDVARAVSLLASGLLIDPLYGLDPVLDADALAPGCGLIVAADRLEMGVDGTVQRSWFDRELDLGAFVARGAVALKLLVIWRGEDDASARRAMVTEFIERCASLDRLSIVEGVVRAPSTEASGAGSWDRDGAIVEAAAELGSLRPDLYKAEVPTAGRGAVDEIAAASERITSVLPCPWVVLSAGVEPDDFPRGVEGACLGGASGVLAGRAIWAPAIRTPRPAEALRLDARARFSRVVEIVDRLAQPWNVDRSSIKAAAEAAAGPTTR